MQAMQLRPPDLNLPGVSTRNDSNPCLHPPAGTP